MIINKPVFIPVLKDRAKLDKSYNDIKDQFAKAEVIPLPQEVALLIAMDRIIQLEKRIEILEQKLDANTGAIRE